MTAVLFWFRTELRQFFANVSELTLRGAGFEATARSQVRVAATLGASDAVSQQEAGLWPEPGRVAAAVSDIVTTQTLRRTRRVTIMWVDDRPENNRYEREALQALGMEVVAMTSTESALETLESRHFDAIISDMGRPPDPRAGYTLLDALRAQGNTTPFVIYAGSNASEHRAEAATHGAIGSTNRPDELLRLVIQAVTATV